MCRARSVSSTIRSTEYRSRIRSRAELAQRRRAASSAQLAAARAAPRRPRPAARSPSRRHRRRSPCRPRRSRPPARRLREPRSPRRASPRSPRRAGRRRTPSTRRRDLSGSRGTHALSDAELAASARPRAVLAVAHQHEDGAESTPATTRIRSSGRLIAVRRPAQPITKASSATPISRAARARAPVPSPTRASRSKP